MESVMGKGYFLTAVEIRRIVGSKINDDDVRTARGMRQWRNRHKKSKFRKEYVRRFRMKQALDDEWWQVFMG